MFKIVVFIALCVLTDARRYDLGPLVDPGVFVITHIQSCRNGAGYCILGKDCKIDLDFVSDDLGGHCNGLGDAFPPAVNFVCCKESAATMPWQDVNKTNAIIVPIPTKVPISNPITKVTTPKPINNAPQQLTVEPTDPITVMKPKLEFEKDSITPQITTGSLPKQTNKPKQACGQLGGQAVLQSFGRAAVRLLPDSIASWVTGIDTQARSISIGSRNYEVTSTVIYCWLVAIVDKESGDLSCTGTLVQPDLVVVSGKCLDVISQKGQDAYDVIVGDSNLKIDLPYGVQKHAIQNAYQYPKYSPDTMMHNIGLIKLKKQVEITNTVCLLCLPTDSHSEIDRCSLTGYAREINKGVVTKTTDGILRTTYVDKPINCNQNKAATPRNSDYFGPKVCIEGEMDKPTKQEECQVSLDTGSPLSCRNSAGSFQLTGILSEASPCSRNESSLTNISYYLDWIESHL